MDTLLGHQGVFTIQYFTGGRFEQKRTYRLGRICRNDAPRTTYHQSRSIIKIYFLWNQQLPVKLYKNCTYTCTKHFCFIFLYNLETSTNWPNKPLTQVKFYSGGNLELVICCSLKFGIPTDFKAQKYPKLKLRSSCLDIYQQVDFRSKL